MMWRVVLWCWRFSALAYFVDCDKYPFVQCHFKLLAITCRPRIVEDKQVTMLPYQLFIEERRRYNSTINKLIEVTMTDVEQGSWHMTLFSFSSDFRCSRPDGKTQQTWKSFLLRRLEYWTLSWIALALSLLFRNGAKVRTLTQTVILFFLVRNATPPTAKLCAKVVCENKVQYWIF